jgi:hypothetical protein
MSKPANGLFNSGGLPAEDCALSFLDMTRNLHPRRDIHKTHYGHIGYVAPKHPSHRISTLQNATKPQLPRIRNS